MTIDVAAERGAALARNEGATREQWLTMRASRLRREGEQLTVEGAGILFPGLALERLEEIVDRAKADVQTDADRERVQVTVWTKERMVERGAELFREHPAASAGEIYDVLEQEAAAVGALACARSSWIGSYATVARRRAHEQNPSVLLGRNAKMALGGPKRRKKPRVDESERPDPEVVHPAGEPVEEGREDAERPEAEATPRTTPDTSAGSRPAAELTVRVGDAKLSAYARALGDPWTVEYSGVVDAEMLVTRRERTGQNTFFTGKSFDDVMSENGVDFDRDRARYLAYERAARAQMKANLAKGRR